MMTRTFIGKPFSSSFSCFFERVDVGGGGCWESGWDMGGGRIRSGGGKGGGVVGG